MATQTIWSYLVNPILSVTEGSFRLAIRISTYHIGALKSKQGDPFYDQLISDYQPLHDNLVSFYESWKAATGGQQGKTLTVNQLLKLLSSTKARQWDIATQMIYAINTEEYKKLFPRRRVPFQQGSQTDKLTAVEAFVKAIGSDASLVTVKNDAEKFYNQLYAALEIQKSSIALKGSFSDEVETARIAMSVGQYANLGALINKYAATPEYINQFFDLVAIRSGQQVIFTGDTKPLETENILKHTFGVDDDVKLENEGITTLIFFLAAQKNDAPGSTTITVMPQTTVTVKASDLGDIKTNTFLNVKNNDAVNKGEWTVEFV